MSQARPVAFFDTECYPNYWLFRARAQSGEIYVYELRAGQMFDSVTAGYILALFDYFCMISFNGNAYDIPMIIAAVLAEYTPMMLKTQNDRIIVGGVKPWELDLPRWKPVDHIDVIEVCPGSGSQKLYAGRVHHKTMRDLPYPPSTVLTEEQIANVSAYCANDLGQLEHIFDSLEPQLEQRVALSARYGIDLRSKSDAQLAEAVLKLRCEKALGRKIYKPEIDWNLRFKFEVPPFVTYQSAQLNALLNVIRNAEFKLAANLTIEMPKELEELAIPLGGSVYRLGIGGLHSSEKRAIHRSDAQYVIRDNDVASYYPSLILNSGRVPEALGFAFAVEYAAIKAERLAAKELQGKLKKQGDTASDAYLQARVENEGGKVMINGTFGKTLSPYSVLFAPQMGIQTTVSGQLSILMLIEWHEYYGISVISANTDGFVIKCPRDKVDVSKFLIAEWEKRTSLEMETVEYAALYSRDVNNYIAIKPDGSTKRKGEYGPLEAGPTAYLNEKRNPGNEICADAVAAYLARGVPLEQTLHESRDICKFVTVQNVKGGAVKMWGDGPQKDMLVRDMLPGLHAAGWIKSGRYWITPYDDFQQYDARTAYKSLFKPQVPESLGKVIRWYYSTNAPGPIVYEGSGNLVSSTWGAKPCMTLPDEFPLDIDYAWYYNKAYDMIKDLGV